MIKRIFIIVISIQITLTLFCQETSTNHENKTQNNNVFKSLKVFYYDSIASKSNPVYREFKFIGEEPYLSKPQYLNVEIECYQDTLYGDIEVFIQELIEPNNT